MQVVPAEFTRKFVSLVKAVWAGFDRLQLCGALQPVVYAQLDVCLILMGPKRSHGPVSRNFADHAQAIRLSSSEATHSPGAASVRELEHSYS